MGSATSTPKVSFQCSRSALLAWMALNNSARFSSSSIHSASFPTDISQSVRTTFFFSRNRFFWKSSVDAKNPMILEATR